MQMYKTLRSLNYNIIKMGFRRKSHDLRKTVSHFYEKEEYNYNMWFKMMQTIKINRNKISRFLIVWLSHVYVRSGYLQSTVNSQKALKWLSTVNCH